MGSLLFRYVLIPQLLSDLVKIKAAIVSLYRIGDLVTPDQRQKGTQYV